MSSTIDSQTSTIKMTTRRKLDTAQTDQFVIPTDVAIDMGYAFTSNTNNIGVKHTSRGSWTLLLPSDGSAGTGAGYIIYQMSAAIAVASILII